MYNRLVLVENTHLLDRIEDNQHVLPSSYFIPFCFFFVLPMGIKFLLGFGTEKLFPMIKIGSYISFVAYMTLAFGLVFELPVVSYFLGKVGIVTPQILTKGRRYAVVGILILAAVLTPSPDVFSQMMLAGPLYFLYEVSILVVRSVQKKKKTQSAGSA